MDKRVPYYLTTIIRDVINNLISYMINFLHKIVQSCFSLGTKTFRFWGIAILTSLLFIVLAHLNIAPVRSQLINLPEALQQEQSFDRTQVGNLDVAQIKLDGQVLFSVATPTANKLSKNSTSAIERRVKAIQFHLSDIVKRGFDPDTLKVTKSKLNNKTILVASDKDWGPRNILTVTINDVELDEPGSIDEIAQKWAKVIKEALLKAQEQRQPEYQKQQIPFVLGILAVMMVGSFGIRKLQKIRGAIRQRLEQYQRKLEAAESDPSDLTSSPTPKDENSLQPFKEQRRFKFSRYLPQLTLEQQISVNLILRRILMTAQIIIWFGGMAIIFHLFPQTRAGGDWLLRFPLAYICIPLGIALLKSVVDTLLRWYIRVQVDQIKEEGGGDVRLRSRALSILSVLEELTAYLAIALGFLLFFYVIKALQIALIAIAVIAFVSQNTLQDFLQTFFLLSEDQYALGDWIQIGDMTGKVEKISMRASQVRSRCGDLFTIPHASFNEVTNFSHGYSGINLFIDVAYKTNLDRAIAVIDQVAKGMQQDSVWGKYIIASQMKGVENFGDNSITIRLILKTDAGQQWDVGREYRRRLKPAFDKAGIEIPFPQRSIWFENPLMVDEKMMSK